MNTLLNELARLQGVLTSAATAAPAGSVDIGAIDPFVCGLRRKCRFAMMHFQLLQSVDWSQVDGLGREPAGTAPPSPLIVKMQDAHLEIRHPSAVVDHVYLAADGVIAAVGNKTDTFARLINVVYRLGLNERKANLFQVCESCVPTSALGTVLKDKVHRTWLERVRDLRGRCQHADVEHILMTPAGNLGRRTEPHVPAAYCWHQYAVDMPVAAYAKASLDAAEATLFAASRAIVICTLDPTK